MFTVEEVAEQLSVSKVTIYAKLKKFDDRVVLKQGKKYITEELLSLIKQDLKVKEVENNIEITIEDTGIGISKEDQEFIFKRFSQVEGTGPINVSSSGIGLTLVKYIAELHGGDIRLESETNKGSKFTIILPDVLQNIELNNSNI